MKYFLFVMALFLMACSLVKPVNHLPDIIVSTDIGGDDPDDYQSLVHLLLYLDRLHIKGLISSPPSSGRKAHIEEVLEAYKKDFPNLSKHARFPTPKYLFSITKQGEIDPQPAPIPKKLSDGSQWIIKQANKQRHHPLYILVWGALTDVAQAVHYQPTIKRKIRIYSIGSWNTVQDSNARNYLYNYHPDLWWIENNTTFRGMYMGGYQQENYGNLTFVENHVKNHGHLGKLFWEKKKDIKMGDTPSVLYFLHGDIEHPEEESWGGSFVSTDHSPTYWTDNKSDSLIENGKHGAKTVSRFRKDFLDDWAKRMKWALPK